VQCGNIPLPVSGSNVNTYLELLDRSIALRL
jgi:hypothetical protein